jgi:hypothetical protein
MSVRNDAASSTNVLAASQHYFGAASRWRTIQLAVVVIIPAGLATWGVFSRHAVFWIPLYGFVAAVIDATLFNWLISNARYRAAQLHSEYDASLVLKAPARSRLVGGPSRDTIFMRSDSFTKTAHARSKTRHWYYQRISELKLPIAELLYVRGDLAQDEGIREPYVTLLSIIFLIGFVGLVSVAAAYGWNVGVIAATVLVPALPVAAWLGREIIDQILTLQRKRCVRELLDDRLISEQINPNSPDDPLVLEREALHGMQFLFRSTQPSVAGWFASWRSDAVREAMEHVLDEQINDASKAGHSRARSTAGDLTQR